jgi:hypothetical protein
MKIVLSENIIQQIINKQILNQKSFEPPVQTIAPTPTQTIAPTPTQTIAPTPAQTIAPTPAQTIAPTPAQTIAPTPAQTIAPTPTPTPTIAPLSIITLPESSQEIQFGKYVNQWLSIVKDIIFESDSINIGSLEQEHKNILDTLIIKPKNVVFIIISVIFIILILFIPNIFTYDDGNTNLG